MNCPWISKMSFSSLNKTKYAIKITIVGERTDFSMFGNLPQEANFGLVFNQRYHGKESTEWEWKRGKFLVTIHVHVPKLISVRGWAPLPRLCGRIGTICATSASA